MTEIQPSPSGYRGQDEAPGPPPCSPGSFKYASHAHHPEQQPQQQQQQQVGNNYSKSNTVGYTGQEGFVNKHQQNSGSTRGSSPGEQQNHNGGYRRKSEGSAGRRNSNGENESNVVGLAETNNQIGNKKGTIAGYNEGYKKNTPGYKNDSGSAILLLNIFF